MPLSHLTENKNEPTTISTPSPPHTPILENSPLKVPNMPESTETPTLKRPYFECKSDGTENVWKRSRRRILDAIQELQCGSPSSLSSPPSPSSPSTHPDLFSIRKDKEIRLMKMNVQLMNGEIPQNYLDLTSRFQAVDVFLKHQFPRHLNIKDIHNYLLLSDVHLDFLESHVENIVYLYSYPHQQSSNQQVYNLGRIVPHSPYDISFLTLQYPDGFRKVPSKQQFSCLSSTRNLNAIFQSMSSKEKSKEVNEVHTRLQTLQSNIQLYIDDQYQAFLKRTSTKPCCSGRVVTFTMDELGDMPRGSIPPPIVYSNPVLKALFSSNKKDAVSSKSIPTTTPNSVKTKDSKVDKSHSMELSKSPKVRKTHKEKKIKINVIFDDE